MRGLRKAFGRVVLDGNEFDQAGDGNPRHAKTCAMALPQIILVRHGETAWSLSGQHTGRTDIPLTEKGERDARALRDRLAGRPFARVLTSPLIRARHTCELAGFGGVAEPEPDLMEWDYGEYEGKRTAEIRAARPGWNAFEHGCPGGETLADVAVRANRLVGRLRSMDADALLFAHRDILRVLAACWAELPVLEARRLYIEPASLSVLGYDHGRDEPILRSLNT
jgi:broad specificity phosphatase PhoE